MSKISRDQIDAIFVTGSKPTQAQFKNTHDSFFHKDDAIPMDNIHGLDDALEQASSGAQATSRKLMLIKAVASEELTLSHTLGAGTILNKISLVQRVGSPVVSCGYAWGQKQIMVDKNVVNGTPTNVAIDRGFLTNTDIYFNVAGGEVLVILDIEQDYYKYP